MLVCIGTYNRFFIGVSQPFPHGGRVSHGTLDMLLLCVCIKLFLTSLCFSFRLAEKPFEIQ
jgi:hypothetical protein